MIVYEEPDFLDLPTGLAALFSAAGELSFFSQAAWLSLIARHASEPGKKIRLYADSQDPSAALACRTDGDRRLGGLANFYSLAYGPVTRGNDSAGVTATARLAAEIGSERPAWQAFTFPALDPAEPGYAALLDGLRSARLLVRPFFDSGTWFEDTQGLAFRRYFDERPAVLRNTYRRKAKAAREQSIEYVFAESGSNVEPLIADYETVYRKSWKKGEPFPNFMPELMRLASGLGALRLGIIRIGGVPAAAQFWLVWRGRAIIYKLAHDERFQSLSLGTLLTMRMFERVLEIDKPLEINFGRGDDPYKRTWLGKRRERWGLYATNPRTVRGLGYSIGTVAGLVRDRLTARRHDAAPG